MLIVSLKRAACGLHFGSAANEFQSILSAEMSDGEQVHCRHIDIFNIEWR